MALPLSFFWSFIVRPLWGMGRAGDRLRTILSILAVGLGVGVILAIHLANRSSIGSFETSLTESWRLIPTLCGPLPGTQAEAYR